MSLLAFNCEDNHTNINKSNPSDERNNKFPETLAAATVNTHKNIPINHSKVNSPAKASASNEKLAENTQNNANSQPTSSSGDQLSHQSSILDKGNGYSIVIPEGLSLTEEAVKDHTKAADSKKDADENIDLSEELSKLAISNKSSPAAKHNKDNGYAVIIPEGLSLTKANITNEGSEQNNLKNEEAKKAVATKSSRIPDSHPAHDKNLGYSVVIPAGLTLTKTNTKANPNTSTTPNDQSSKASRTSAMPLPHHALDNGYSLVIPAGLTLTKQDFNLDEEGDKKMPDRVNKTHSTTQRVEENKAIQRGNYEIVVPQGLTLTKSQPGDRAVQNFDVDRAEQAAEPMDLASRAAVETQHQQKARNYGPETMQIERIHNKISELLLEKSNAEPMALIQASVKINQPRRQVSFPTSTAPNPRAIDSRAKIHSQNNNNFSSSDNFAATSNNKPVFQAFAVPQHTFGSSNPAATTFNPAPLTKPPLRALIKPNQPESNPNLPPLAQNPYNKHSLAEIGQLIKLQEGLLGNKTVLNNLPDNGQKVEEKYALLKQAYSCILDRELAQGAQFKPPNNTANSISNLSNSIPPATFLPSNSTPKLQYVGLEESSQLQASKFPSKSSKASASTATSGLKSAAVDEFDLSKLFRSLSVNLSSAGAQKSEDLALAGLKTKLFPYQIEAISWMEQRESADNPQTSNNLANSSYFQAGKEGKIELPRGGIIADDCGLGKTLQTLAFIAKQKQQHRNRDQVPKISGNLIISCATLVICPKSLLQSWESQISQHFEANSLSFYTYYGSQRDISAEKIAQFDIILTTYATIRTEFANFNENLGNSALYSVEFGRIVLDEGHNIRNPRAQQSIAVFSLYSRCFWFLSATPIHNNFTDFFAIFKFLRFKPYNSEQFFTKQLAKQGNQGENSKNIGKLRFFLQILMLRRMKNDKIGPNQGENLVNLPQKHLITHKLQFSRVEQQFYSELRSGYAKILRDSAGKSQFSSYNVAFTMLLRLRQCCDNYFLVIQAHNSKNNDPNSESEEDIKEIKGTKEEIDTVVATAMKKFDFSAEFEMNLPFALSAKLSFLLSSLESILSSNSDEKIVIFSQFTSFLDQVSALFRTKQLKFARLDGKMSVAAQNSAISAFNNDNSVRIFLISLKSGGVGLNLTRGNHCFVLDPWWNPAIELQAHDRIHRVGQEREVFIHRMYVGGSVEEGLLQLQQKKQKLADEVLDEGRKDQQGEENKAKLSFAELKALFAE
jgi:SNF2 family DNA or RNA helicase